MDYFINKMEDIKNQLDAVCSDFGLFEKVESAAD